MATSRYNQFPQDRCPKLRLIVGETGQPARADQDDLTLRVAMLERERRELRDELAEAAQVERRLSGPRQLRIQGLEMASEVFPVRWLAGDFVCAMDIGLETWIALGDIGGKGLAAAMWFTHLVSLIRCHALHDRDSAAVMRKLNRDLCALQPAPPLTSMVLFVVDREGRTVEYCNAGHPAPLVVRADGNCESLEAGGPLLGVLDGAAYQAGNTVLRAGDLLLGCTDGVTECCNAAGEEFGHERLLRTARGFAHEPAQALLFSILGALQDFAGTTPRHDDISLLVLRQTASAAA